MNQTRMNPIEVDLSRIHIEIGRLVWDNMLLRQEIDRLRAMVAGAPGVAQAGASNGSDADAAESDRVRT